MTYGRGGAARAADDMKTKETKEAKMGAVEKIPANAKAAYFAGGCFWGVEYYFDKEPGVISAVSGYMGGHKDDPTYHEVSSGRTGHAETVRILYDPEKTTYEKLARLFFDIHDPTQVNHQGPDYGTQYRSAVFYKTPEEKATIEKLIGLLKERGYKVATQIVEGGEFYAAEDYHQDYYEHKGSTPYCHFKTDRFGDEDDA
ncbi:MAG: peptide-methionine (S)-S-oxide reductase MsrA [Deltaproteobacteria bacterium]|nr:peptide-methionine (S)-S-oxide reductase MsrA [Deltaproteobacteria bacterium]MCB9490361.1 peptide-methionine (S)-S-oxide reductase MsrA [Deltaproteobacteria bacterium]